MEMKAKSFLGLLLILGLAGIGGLTASKIRK